MPGLDRFEILFYSDALDRLVYKIEDIRLAETGGQFTYRMPKDKVNALVNGLRQLPYSPRRKLVVVVKGSASGAGVPVGAIASGPYYGNAEVFSVELRNKLAVIAVDSSGSNQWTDPGYLRIGAAQKMLEKMGRRNADIAAGTAANKAELPTMVAALDFDGYTHILSPLAPAQDLAARRIFNAVDSWGGTDVAAAINQAAGLLNPTGVRGPRRPFPNTSKTYVLTDMDNNAGMAPVVVAIRESGAQGIPVNLGHLMPLLNTTLASGQLHGEPFMPRKLAEPMDPVVEALLASGGSYAVIENAQAQDAWTDLMDELNSTDPATRTEVRLPLDVKLYGLAVAHDGRSEPVYLFDAAQSGAVVVKVDGKGHFVPDVRVNGAGGQTSAGQDQYELRFTAQAGQTYRISLNEDAAAAGLYSIVLRQSIVAGPLGTVPVPVNHPVMLFAAALLVLLAGACTQRLRMRRTGH